MGDYVAFDNQCIQEMQASNASILQALEAINPPNDSSLFIQLVSKPWPEPVDITFESAAEFDTSSLATDVTNVFVLITLQKNLVEIDTLQKDVTTQTKTIDGLKTLKDAYEKDPKLGDAVEVWQNIIDGERVQLLKEGLKLKYQTQNDVIRSAVGDIQLVPHQATKTTSSGSCAVCQQSFSLFGKGIQCTGLISFLFFLFFLFFCCTSINLSLTPSSDSLRNQSPQQVHAQSSPALRNKVEPASINSARHLRDHRGACSDGGSHEIESQGDQRGQARPVSNRQLVNPLWKLFRRQFAHCLHHQPGDVFQLCWHCSGDVHLSWLEPW